MHVFVLFLSFSLSGNMSATRKLVYTVPVAHMVQMVHGGETVHMFHTVDTVDTIDMAQKIFARSFSAQKSSGWCFRS